MDTPTPSTIPTDRIHTLNQQPENTDGNYVLYWMVGTRRLTWNYALERAVEIANKHHRPLLIFEGLRAQYPWASERIHRFILDGMHEHACTNLPERTTYLPYIECTAGDGSGLLELLADGATHVVTDHYPAFFLRRMIPTVGQRLRVKTEAVDSCGVVPLATPSRSFPRAFSFRKHLHTHFADFLEEFPSPNPLSALSKGAPPKLPDGISHWDFPCVEELSPDHHIEQTLPIDHTIKPVSTHGGATSAQQRWQTFLKEDLVEYANGRNHPDDDRSSQLSPWLHFGHISSHQIVRELLDDEHWSPDKTNPNRTGKNTGWWGLSDGAESFLDELITWRELGYNHAHREDNYCTLESIPQWARKTIEEHRNDERPYTYSLKELASAQTHDDIWNAAQRQLLQEGRMHNYLRMLWGKKVLEWSPTPEDAFERLVELNNRYALDGRDPNSYSGILWIFGKFDRAWGPERQIYGKLRYMTSKSTRRKLRIKQYLQQYGSQTSIR